MTRGDALDYLSKSLISISEELALKISSGNQLDALNNIKVDMLAYYANTLSKLKNHQQAIEHKDSPSSGITIYVALASLLP